MPLLWSLKEMKLGQQHSSFQALDNFMAHLGMSLLIYAIKMEYLALNHVFGRSSLYVNDSDNVMVIQPNNPYFNIFTYA